MINIFANNFFRVFIQFVVLEILVLDMELLFMFFAVIYL